MKELNDHIEFLEMAETDPQLLAWLLELRRHRENNWQQRAEAAEEKAANLNYGWLNSISERDEARAKLAEYEKQEPIGYHSTEARAVFRVWPDADGKCCVPVYSKPAPAVSLAEMVPNDKELRVLFETWTGGSASHEALIKMGLPEEFVECLKELSWESWTSCRAAILRNIEEPK